MTRKALAGMIAVIMICAMIAGCSTTSVSSPTASPAAAVSAAATTAATATAQMSADAKYSPEINISYVAAATDQLQKLTLKSDYTMEKNPWTDAYLDKFGIILKPLWIASSSEEFNTKLNLALASGEIPDYMMLSNTTMVQQLMESNSICEIKALYDQYASDLLKQRVDASGESGWLPGARSGKYYAVPSFSGNQDTIKFVWIRKDWLANVGLSAPQNFEELMNVIKVFAMQDPDKNGKNDTYGLALMGKALTSYFGDIESMMHLHHGFLDSWIEKDGKIVYGGVQPEIKPALAKLNELYNAGYIDKEFGVKDDNQIIEDFTSGKQGLAFGDFWASLGSAMNSTVVSDAKADFLPIPIAKLGVDGKSVYTGGTNGVSNYLVISNKCEHPEAIIKMANLFCDLCLNQTSTYSLTADSREMWKLAGGFNFADGGKNLKNYQAVRDVMKNGVANNLTGEQKQMYDNVKKYLDGDRTMWGWYRIFGPEGIDEISEASVEKYSVEDKLLTVDKFVGAPTKTMAEKKSILDTMMLEEYIKIIIGSDSLDKFDEFVKTWGASGGDQMTQEVNDWYASTK